MAAPGEWPGLTYGRRSDPIWSSSAPISDTAPDFLSEKCRLPNAGGIEAMFTSLSIPIFIMDLRELPSAGALHNYFHALHETRNGWFGIYNVAPAESYDAILFIEAITPTVPTSKPESRG
jgi:hypothetical protein